MDRVFRQLRVGDVALNAFDGQLSRQRTAPPVLDHVAERVPGGGFADDAVVDCFSAFAQRLGESCKLSVLEAEEGMEFEC